MAVENDFIHKDLNYEINGCSFEAFKEVGVGFDEITYHKFFHQRLLDKGLKAKYKPPLQAFYRNEKIADFEADELVEDCIVVEAKCIQTGFIPENYAKLFWLIDNSFLLAILAGKDEPRKYDAFRMRSYLNRLQLKHGLIAYWSANNCQFYGLYES